MFTEKEAVDGGVAVVADGQRLARFDRSERHEGQLRRARREHAVRIARVIENGDDGKQTHVLLLLFVQPIVLIAVRDATDRSHHLCGFAGRRRYPFDIIRRNAEEVERFGLILKVVLVQPADRIVRVIADTAFGEI